LPREIIYDYGIFIHWIITVQAVMALLQIVYCTC